MIYNEKQPASSDLSDKFEDFLQYDTVAHIKEAFSLMGRRFIGQPRKSQIAKGIARYVREHPLDVLHKCKADTLMYIKEMIEMGKGSCVTIGEPHVYNLQIQRMEFVLTYYDKKNQHTELYLLDELHDIFAPHLDEAYRNPSDTLKADMAKGLEDLMDLAEGCKTQEEFIAKFKEQFPEIDLGDDDDADGDGANDEIDALLVDAANLPNGGWGVDNMPYSFSDPLLTDIRCLHYNGQAAVCRAFHQILKKGDLSINSRFINRFEEDYGSIRFRELDESIEEIHFCINDLDSIVYEVDLYDPMTFFDLAERLHRVIKLSQDKWPLPEDSTV